MVIISYSWGKTFLSSLPSALIDAPLINYVLSQSHNLENNYCKLLCLVLCEIWVLSPLIFWSGSFPTIGSFLIHMMIRTLISNQEKCSADLWVFSLYSFLFSSTLSSKLWLPRSLQTLISVSLIQQVHLSSYSLHYHLEILSNSKLGQL